MKLGLSRGCHEDQRRDQRNQTWVNAATSKSLDNRIIAQLGVPRQVFKIAFQNAFVPEAESM